MGRPSEDATFRALPAQLGTHTLAGYWAVTPYGGGLNLVRHKSSHGADAFVPASFKAYATGLCRFLNRHLHHDGRWTVCWCEFDLHRGFPANLAVLWADRDGDIQFVVDIDETIAFVSPDYHDIAHYQCEPAWQQWHEMQRAVGAGEGQKIAAALGETSADPRATPDVVPIL